MSQRLTITAAGDMMFDRRLRPPRTFVHFPDMTVCGPFEGQIRYPFVNTRESLEWLSALERPVDGVRATSHASTSIALGLAEEVHAPDYPFSTIATTLRESDIVFGNLECPLTRRTRRMNNDASYSADPAFAAALARAGFNVVSFANNHCFDFGEGAFLDTIDALAQEGINVTGAGRTLAEARTPAVLTANGTRVAFLSYTMIGFDTIYATDDESGAAPMNPLVAGQDIARARNAADVVVVSVHWGNEGRSVPWPRQTELAHLLVDAGADVILGHHSHVPGSVEVYNGRPIFYSLGNFIFGHDHSYWGDNMLARLHFDDARCRRIELLPIRGRYQPALLDAAAAEKFHAHINGISSMFSTAFGYDAPRSVLEIPR